MLSFIGRLVAVIALGRTAFFSEEFVLCVRALHFSTFGRFAGVNRIDFRQHSDITRLVGICLCMCATHAGSRHTLSIVDQQVRPVVLS